ncbi:SUMF1/EgtB/PvdOfamily nonheme iron enzyme [Myxococcus llanfairpwllgwyngyllgogerychwyrndrobwllllantysiliogogogochensis]|uniref:SUMF1/EgtB/PvdOfamily nonheme iron enzyme n=1 Tax=Myxococcus llanfairpwllgwyngyllgogerychwyrndrobwllllantysiliogogogochensis TaxID=2590453 RepID=A0A540WVX0_9BACT|nr:SUMF1/EgtB/PvdO family nonheme iron enzyme [Myxococcus llanfairpwllgwyngyllgogerychwyrndrobwllllantysiliogogogochensis]TQF13161.1 SUMF1/EgtB/PvdOfamily nonheme iron enzyme [Myxococcus llanfairpwllgwyngyllgogerychwyrndrobwllllantysiliogogogochensis]
MSAPPGLLEPPREFEEYQVLRPLGRGAMGQVFLARDTLLDRLVAVKFIATPAGRLPDAVARARFFQEARAIARLQHPNVVAIHRVGEVRGQPYLVSELIRGEPLDTLRRPMDGRQVLVLGIGLARGLAAAHRCGVLHRDIKPANAILSEEGEVKLLDFGLAESWTGEDGPRALVWTGGTSTAGLRDARDAGREAPLDTGRREAPRATRDTGQREAPRETLDTGRGAGGEDARGGTEPDVETRLVSHVGGGTTPKAQVQTRPMTPPGDATPLNALVQPWPMTPPGDATSPASRVETRPMAPLGENAAPGQPAEMRPMAPPRENVALGQPAETRPVAPLGENIAPGQPAQSRPVAPPGEDAAPGQPAETRPMAPPGEDFAPGQPAETRPVGPPRENVAHGQPSETRPRLAVPSAPHSQDALANEHPSSTSQDSAPSAHGAQSGAPRPTTDHREVASPRDDSSPGGPWDGVPPAHRGPSPLPLTVPGTPLYLAPELWRGEQASRASDIYAMGVLLHELCTGTAPHEDVPLSDLGRAVLEQRPRLLVEQDLDIPPGLAAVVDRCLALAPEQRFESGDALREALEALAQSAHTSPLPSGNPYRGLRTFEAEHRGVFFGRKAELGEVLDRLRGERFVLLAGDSGVGKSSLCRAGVLPAIASAGRGDDNPAWTIVSWTPGRHPLEALAEALAPVLEEGPDALLAQVATEEPGALARALRRRPSGAPPVLLFIDQLEELVTFSEPTQATRLAEELALALHRVPRIRVLATARSDCLTRLVALPGLGDELPRALYLVRALSERGLREAVEGPARALGVRFESPALVDTLVTSAARADGGLPLLQFALEALWEARDVARGTIPAEALASLGGVEGALARHADAVVEKLRPEQRPRARELLLELVTPEGTRLRRTREELLRGPDDDNGRAVLDGLVRGRLLTAGEAESGEGVYTLAHESLLTGWDTLRGWLGQDEQRRAIRHRLARAATEWARLGQPSELLYAERQLTEARAAGVLPEGAGQEDFLARSHQTARRRRAARWTVAIAAPLALLAVVAVTRVQSRAQLEARIAQHLDEARRHHDDAREKDATARRLRQESLALFDTPGPERREAAETLWARVRDEEQAVETLSLRAQAALETAWGLDPGSPRVNEPLADLLAERAERADRQRQPELRTQLLTRLAAYDTSGLRQRKLVAPARVSIITSPPGARVRLLKATPDISPTSDTARPSDSPAPPASSGQDLGQTPLRELELPAGSHLILVEAPGRFPVRAPILVRPGETLALDLALPEASAVPEGFVYVPPGRFLQGASESEFLRRAFFFSPPLHELETGAYLIARHEVTFGQYITFLETLSPEERTARMPGSRRRLTVVDLAQEPDGRWRLNLRPASASYSVLDGERLRYGKRDRRLEQDWLRFPVSAISFVDAEAYVAWLDHTGQVPGARICTEHEWERAARGADGRRYPGGDWLSPDDANHDVTYGREPGGFGPDEVGSHPRSRSPFGVDDLAGNVWEWTRSSVDPTKPSAQGGSWYQSDLTAHSANRDRVEPTQREALIGLRVCATPRP